VWLEMAPQKKKGPSNRFFQPIDAWEEMFLYASLSSKLAKVKAAWLCQLRSGDRHKKKFH